VFVLTLTLNIIPCNVASSQQDIYATSTQQSPLPNKDCPEGSSDFDIFSEIQYASSGFGLALKS
jgi:hypothetical protein